MTTTRPLPALPDPHRVGGTNWAKRTGARLRARDRAWMAPVAIATQVRNTAQRQRPRLRTPTIDESALTAPDSHLVREAEAAALEQPRALLAHAYRTAIFARALALVDRVAVDDELLYVCALLHDVGLIEAVAGQDFTLRSAHAAVGCARRAGEPEFVADHLADALIAHTTVGVTPERDGALASYTQYGAMVDLTGLRSRHLPASLIKTAVRDHPRDHFKTELLRMFHAEAAAVPGGRFAFLKHVGFPLAVRLAPFET